MILNKKDYQWLPKYFHLFGIFYSFYGIFLLIVVSKQHLRLLKLNAI